MVDSAPPATSSGADTAASHLSIGEVLALLLEEFPDVTISKIRFLESQGLINPERTASGYRKFYGDDVDLLRCILREQRENYLPLRVIKDRIEAGEIDPTNETPRPRGIRNVSESESSQAPRRHPSAGVSRTDSNGQSSDGSASGAAALFMNTDQPSTATPSEADQALSPSSTKKESMSTAPLDNSNAAAQAPAETAAIDHAATPIQPPRLMDADELCELADLTRDALADLESYGVVAPESSAAGGTYGEDALEIATIAKRFLDAGIDSRHLRGWRVSADREAGLLEQLIQPLLRQRNPEARARAVLQLAELESDGGLLRAAMVRSALRHHTSS